MNIIRKYAFARAGLLGNPSDGYSGKTISFSVCNFHAVVVLYEWDSVEILMTKEDRTQFSSVRELTEDIRFHGYSGGIRLVKATIKCFVNFCDAKKIKLYEKKFTIRYSSNIHRQVGLAGSSAIIVTTLRCLMGFYHVEIPLRVQPSLVLSVEKDELGISAGLQDRVIQCYEGLVFMDFSEEKAEIIDGLKCYHYEKLDPKLLPPLYISFHENLGEPTEVFHNDIRNRFNQGERSLIKAMKRFASYAQEGLKLLLKEDHSRLAEVINANFDLRRSILQLPNWQLKMIKTSRKVGASAKFAGSGGAIVGTIQNEQMFKKLSEEMAAIGSKTIRPSILPNN